MIPVSQIQVAQGKEFAEAVKKGVEDNG